MRTLEAVTVRDTGDRFVLAIRDGAGETSEFEATAAQLDAAVRALGEAQSRIEGRAEPVYQKPLG